VLLSAFEKHQTFTDKFFALANWCFRMKFTAFLRVP